MKTLSDILVFIIDTIGSLYISVVLIRVLLQMVRADFYNPLSKAIVKLTNPLVLPLRKFIPGFFGIDWASLFLALLLQMLLLIIIRLIGGYAIPGLGSLVVVSIYMLIMNVLVIYIFAMLVVVVVSWIAPQSYNPTAQLLNQLLRPFLAPIQRVIPPVAGLDFSPMVFLMALMIIRNFLLPALARGLGLA